MAKNDKLTEAVKGRTISGTGNSGDVLTISFTDDSKMSVKTKGSTNSASTGGTIETADQTPETLTLTMEGGGSLEIPIAGEKGAVRVQDSKGAEEYAD